MRMRKMIPCVFALVLAAAGLHASEEAAKPHAPGVPLRLQVVFDRSLGEKTVSSHAYALGIETGGEVTTLKAGLQVPILRDGTTLNFKDAATRIQCAAEDLSSGRFRLSLELDQTAPTDVRSANAPVLHTFGFIGSLTLRDGQTVQYLSSSDPVTGETLKVQVALTVVR
jgi:hypothetical protein